MYTFMYVKISCTTPVYNEINAYILNMARYSNKFDNMISVM